ncbi:hypothetical protein M758_4G244400 [Ceratodon purpureus]|nr:hypothetical protein M758_4G244400 [Ceratodon purpureus]
MSAVLARPSVALHLLSANPSLKRQSVSLLRTRHVHPIRSSPGRLRLLCSLDSNATKAAAPSSNELLALVPGGKHLSLTDQVYSYILRHTREPQILQELREEMAESPGSNMQIPPDQGQFLALLVQLIGAKRCIEVGVFHGYSSLAVALVLPEGGRLVACDRDERSLAIAREYYRRAGVLHKVDIRHGLAVDTLKSLLQNGDAGSYDYAFLDADKMMYREYYELLLQLVKPNGLIVVDNTLWYGRTADPLVNDKRTQFLREFNKFLAVDERISVSMVPIGDGMTLCRKQ